MASKQCLLRLNKEVTRLTSSPPEGVSAWPAGDGSSLQHLEARLIGPEDTPYEGGVFALDVSVPDRYPFEPPRVRFVTPVYHPNIDAAGRICLDTLKSGQKGAWRPSLNISTVLQSVRLLLSEPNGDDGLMADVTEQFKHDREGFEREARRRTKEHAVPKAGPADTTCAPGKVHERRPEGNDGPLEAGASGGRADMQAEHSVPAQPPLRQPATQQQQQQPQQQSRPLPQSPDAQPQHPKESQVQRPRNDGVAAAAETDEECVAGSSDDEEAPAGTQGRRRRGRARAFAGSQPPAASHQARDAPMLAACPQPSAVAPSGTEALTARRKRLCLGASRS